MENAIDIRTIPKTLYDRYIRQSHVIQEEAGTLLYFGADGICEAVHTKILLTLPEENMALYVALVWDKDKAHFMIFKELPLVEEKMPLLEIRTNVRPISFKDNEGYLYDMVLSHDPIRLLNPLAPFLNSVGMAALDLQRSAHYKNFFVNPEVSPELIMGKCLP